jgi:lipoprotein-releasing system ATP-binding protein
MMKQDTTTLQLQNVQKSYGSSLTVLENISFSMSINENLAITGPSGSGKSTLLHIIGTLDQPTGGQLLINNRNPAELSERELAGFRNQVIGFVFQQHYLLPQYTVLENVQIPAMAGNRNEFDAGERAYVLLQKVGLAERISHLPSELSGGERQRVAIARALINKPQILLCDEPTGNLDIKTSGAIADLFFELHKQENTILITVTHSRELSDRFQRRFELREGHCFEA